MAVELYSVACFALEGSGCLVSNRSGSFCQSGVCSTIGRKLLRMAVVPSEAGCCIAVVLSISLT